MQGSAHSLTERNIFLIYLFRAFLAADSLIVPMLLPLYRAHEISFSQVAALQSTFALTVVIFQLPMGWIADLFGRRNVLIIGALLGVISRLCYVFGTHFEVFLCAEIFLGIGLACITGTDISILYDSLANQQRSHYFPKAMGRSRAFELFICGVCAIVSGYIASTFSVDTVFSLGCTGYLITAVVAFCLVEPERKKAPSNLKQMFQVCSEQVRSNPVIPWCIIFFAALFAINQPLVFLWEPFLKSSGVTLQETGWFFSGMFFWGALIGWITPRCTQKYGELKVLCILLTIDIISFFGVSLLVSPYAALFFLGNQSVRSSLNVVIQSTMNRFIDSRVRTTIMSLLSMSGYIVYSLVFIPLGIYKAHHSFQELFLLMGGLGLVVAWWVLRSHAMVARHLYAHQKAPQ